MSDPWTEAWEESEATAPPGTVKYFTIELQHPAFLEDDVEVPVRCVTGVDEPMDFGIEEGADFNGGETVTFAAIPFYAERPEFAEGKTPECEVVVDGVNRELTPRLEAAVQVKANLTVLYREYLSDDLTEPCYGPIEFVMRRVRVSGTRVVGIARLDDLANRRFPNKVASVAEFPGLVN